MRNSAIASGRDFVYPLGAVPTLPQLIENFAIFRRPQTAHDRSWTPKCGCGTAARQLSDLTRFTTALPEGYRVFVDVEQLLLGGQLNMAAGSYVLNLDIVDPRGNVSSTSFGPNTQYALYPLSSDDPLALRSRPNAKGSVWAGVVPDGVSTVSWTFECPGGRHGASPCAGARPRTVTVHVVNNVAARRISGLRGCGGYCVQQVIWRSDKGRVVASFGGFGNLPAPPFVKGGRGSRKLDVLFPSGVGRARLGQPSAGALQTITRLLGPPADANVPAGGCGIDHESVWTSPAVADPLTIFQREGRFVGYQYGAPVAQIGLRRGPGAVLATRRGLTLDDTVAVARRLYVTGFMTSTAGGGTWRARADGGTVRGSVLPISYPLRAVTAKNPVATIDAGAISCPAGAD